MGKKIALTILGVVLGMAAGATAMMACHTASLLVYPLPEGVDMMNPEHQEQFHAWMRTAPTGAFLLAALCHWIGTGTGVVIAMLVSGRKWLVPAVVVGALFTLGGVLNLTSIPHPGWFAFVDLPGYLLVAWLVGRWLMRTPPTSEASGRQALPEAS